MKLTKVELSLFEMWFNLFQLEWKTIEILALGLLEVLYEASESDDDNLLWATMQIVICIDDVSFLVFFQSWKMDKMNMGLEHLS